MAARENQGLQIALIIFVILTIVLIVTTYMFFSSYSQERDRAKSLAEQKASADKATQDAIADTEQVKTLLGGDPAIALPELNETATADFEAYNLVETKQNYRGLVEHMAAKIRELEETTTTQASEIAQLNEKLKTNEEAAQAEVAQYVQKLEQTASDLEGERTKFTAARTEITGQMEQLASNFQSTQAEREAAAQQTAAQITSLSGDLKRSEDLLDRMRNKEAADAKANEYPDGKVTRVNQRTRLVWLNVGPADGLRNQTSFVVVAPDEVNPVQGESKARLQVVRLTDDHQAEARILEDDLSNPIMPGDLIFSTVWDANRQQHFALVGRMDIDGDGDDDRQLVHDLIEANGGVIDAEVIDGQKSGEMSLDTRYLVVGERPDAEGGNIQAFSAMMGEAQKLGVNTIDVSEFIDYMGYKGQERTVNLGSFATPTDFKPRFPNGVQPRVRGNNLPQEFRRPRGAQPRQ